MRPCLRRNQPGPYQIQAAINAVHSDAAKAAATDWAQIVQLYDQLTATRPVPVVALNRAVAVAEVQGPRTALGLLERLGNSAAESAATTSTTPSGPICCGGWGRAPMRRRPTSRPSPSPATRPSGPSCAAAWSRFLAWVR